MVGECRKNGLTSVVVSFGCARAEEALTTELEKAYLLEKMGVDVMISLPGMYSVDRTLIRRLLGARLLFAGAECPKCSLPEACGTEVKRVDTVYMDGEPVTAGRVAAYLDAGNMEKSQSCAVAPILCWEKWFTVKPWGGRWECPRQT